MYVPLTITGSSCTVAITNEFVLIFIFCELIQAHFHRPTGKFPHCLLKRDYGMCVKKKERAKRFLDRRDMEAGQYNYRKKDPQADRLTDDSCFNRDSFSL